MSAPKLPYGRQWIDEDDIAAVADVLRGDFLTTGPAVADLERKMAAAGGVRHAVAVNSGTSALHCAYFAAGLGEGDEIITCPMTFVATSNAALYLGAKPVFVDCEPDTGNIDSSQIEAAITPRTKAIAPIDFTGHPADYNAVTAIARKHGLIVVADAAHSFGASYQGRPVGSLADMTEISTHPVKPFTTGEGGAVLCDNDDLADKCARFRTHGITRIPAQMAEKDPGGWHYEMVDLGFNYRLTDIQCALGSSQIAKLSKYIERRREVAALYNKGLSDIASLDLPVVQEGVQPGWHLYVVRVKDKTRRRAFFERLRELGLLVQVHYIPVHWHPYYQGLGFQRGQFPASEDYFERAVSLPMYPKMSDDDAASSIERVRQAAKDVL